MAEPLRIAQVAPIATPVTPSCTGSIEQLVWLLTEELVRRGHEVTLFATGDSQTTAALYAAYARGYEHEDDLWDHRFHETMHMASVFECADDFDVIHSHDYHFALPFMRLVPTPVVHSYHIMPDDDVARAYGRYPDAHLVAISHYQAQAFPSRAGVDVVYHGIDTTAFSFSSSSGDYLLFFGRIRPGKGAVEAIDLARQSGMRLVMAGPDEDGYFEATVAPLVDGRWVEYVGPVRADARNHLLGGASALLFPISEPEPFGLVMVEAMAAGTPVVAVGLGAVPEIVENGVTGYYSHDLASLAQCIPAATSLNRARIRDVAVARFDYHRMVDDYEAIYRRLAEDRSPGR